MSQRKAKFSYVSPWSALACWPIDQPRLFLGGSGRYCALGLDARTVDSMAAWSQVIGGGQTPGQVHCESIQQKGPFAPGFVSLISYDDFAPSGTIGTHSRTWRVPAFLVWDQVEQRLWLHGDCEVVTRKLLEDCLATAQRIPPPGDPGGWAWQALTSSEAYLQQARSVQDDIRNGRYYQLNLLRYFRLQSSSISTAAIAGRLAAVGGRYSAWIDDLDLSLVSFSPERFIRLRRREGGDVQIWTYPIKGTAARDVIPAIDAERRQSLEQNGKEQAELNMIVDLMRNDLQQVCQSRSVQVRDVGSIRELPHVFHRQATIVGTMQRECRLVDLLRAVCPAGSITGAPKREVMRAIREFEGRDRGYFMGNLMYWSDDGARLDSSVLIRTMVSTKRNAYEFAAGSGMVLESHPELEQDEIRHKCRVVMQTCAE